MTWNVVAVVFSVPVIKNTRRQSIIIYTYCIELSESTANTHYCTAEYLDRHGRAIFSGGGPFLVVILVRRTKISTVKSVRPDQFYPDQNSSDRTFLHEYWQKRSQLAAYRYFYIWFVQ